MKRLRAAIICVCMLSVFLGGCGQTKTVTGETAKTDGTAPTGSAAADSLTVEPYQIGTGTSAFTERIDENPLDTAYEKERQSAVTTQDFCAVEEKYAQLWQTELQRSLDDLNGYLTADDKAKLAKQQESWAAFALSETAVNKEILENDGYAVRLGSASAYGFLSERRALIRERTVKIKYLTYLLETQTENPTATENQMWSQFGSAMSERVLADE